MAGAPTAGICPGEDYSSKVFQCQLWHTEVLAAKKRSENTVVSGLEDGGPGSKDAFGGDAYFPFLDFAPPVRRSRQRMISKSNLDPSINLSSMMYQAM